MSVITGEAVAYPGSSQGVHVHMEACKKVKSCIDVRVHRKMATNDIFPIGNASSDMAGKEMVEHLIMNLTEDTWIWLFWIFDTMNNGASHLVGDVVGKETGYV